MINVDDNAPVFGKVSEAKVSEAVQVGTPIVKFNATDKDGSRLTYAITKGNTASAFEIHASTGMLKCHSSLFGIARNIGNIAKQTHSLRKLFV